MAFCAECGAALKDGAKFCTFCGAKQPVEPEAYTPPVQQTYTAQGQQGYYAPSEQGYDPADGMPPKKRGGRKTLPIVLGIVAILAVAAVALVLILGGGESVDDPDLGLYTAVVAQKYGIAISVEDLTAFSVELKPGGRCVVTLGNNRANGRWELDDDRDIEISAGNLDMEGRLVDGRLIIEDFQDSDFDYYLIKEGDTRPAIAEPTAAATPEPTPTPAPTPAPAYLDWWRGDWYGWWIVGNVGGVYEEWQDNWWDCSARIAIGDDGTATVVFWDEYDTESEPTASFTMNISESGAVMGPGFFMDMITYDYDFLITTDYKGIENLIRIEGLYADDEGSFTFAIYLRPWGQLWDDWYAIDDTCLLYYYEDWYLPQISAGASMPGEIAPDAAA